jgi:hypothetical protein
MGGTAADQQAFGAALAKASGLDPQFVQAWLVHEQAPGSPSAPGSNNWLNIGAVSSNPSDWTPTYWAIAAMPATQAGQATAAWMKQNQPSIMAAAGQGAAAQVTALENSGWAAGHYNFQSAIAFLGGTPAPATGIPAPSAPSSPIITAAGRGGTASSTTSTPASSGSSWTRLGLTLGLLAAGAATIFYGFKDAIAPRAPASAP